MSRKTHRISLFKAIADDDVAAVQTVLDSFEPTQARYIVNVFNDADIQPPLYRAIGKNPQIATLLLKAGADPNVPDDKGYNILMQAIAEKDYQVALILIAHGVDVSWQESEGKTTALHTAVFASSRDNDMERIRFVLRCGADRQLTLNWQGQALTPRALAVVLQGEESDIVGVLDHPHLPAPSEAKSARHDFVRGLVGRSGAEKKRYVLK